MESMCASSNNFVVSQSMTTPFIFFERRLNTILCDSFKAVFIHSILHQNCCKLSVCLRWFLIFLFFSSRKEKRMKLKQIVATLFNATQSHQLIHQNQGTCRLQCR
ncbi:hypothetical protein KP509_19G003500 [Ceratopteris richardii]|uniref:Uncharacterized protein n=1 Tax=Ceratopteris richardii TaxID=49495 RepID=A0A8T2SJE1_CERRI|nr:hypothetical protein KP509_19G003500 [Ceratopteris richardii]